VSAEPDRRYGPRPTAQAPIATTRTAPREYRIGLLASLGACVVLLALGVAWYLLPLSDRLSALRELIVDLGVEGIAIFAAIYIVGAIVLAPEALLTIAAGFAYGFWGLPIVLVAATTGASLAFLIARYVAREKVRRLLEKRRNIAAIDQAIAEDGWKVVAFLRLSPLIPFNLQNYLFGVTAIPFRQYVAATFAGIIPGAALYTYLGTLGNVAGDAGPARWALFAFGLLATIAVVILVSRKARAKLRQAELASQLT
jgi:uncharacterized membrane protein YdjX (TVP38/TMEM64 family)